MSTSSIFFPNEAIIQLSDVWYAYGKNGYVLQGIDYAVDKPSINIILGPSGSGKTTFLKIIDGLVTPQRGSVKVLGVDPNNNQKAKTLRQRIGYIPQQLGLIRNRTAIENVLIGGLSRINVAASLLGVLPRHEVDFAERCLDQVGLIHKKNEKVFHLSGGERQRVAIARALMQKPTVILADELTSDLDYVTAHDVMETIEDIHREGVTFIIALHDINLAMEYGEKTIILRNGRKVKELVPDELNAQLVRQVFAKQ